MTDLTTPPGDDTDLHRPSEVTEADVLDASLDDTDDHTAVTAEEADAASGADRAIAWYRARIGSRKFEGMCQKAARLSWGCPPNPNRGSAIEHWRKRNPKHTSGIPPKGSYVFWNISKWGHVGIADGEGGFWATSVGGGIGHARNVHYYRNYLGWLAGGC